MSAGSGSVSVTMAATLSEATLTLVDSVRAGPTLLDSDSDADDCEIVEVMDTDEAPLAHWLARHRRLPRIVSECAGTTAIRWDLQPPNCQSPDELLSHFTFILEEHLGALLRSSGDCYFKFGFTFVPLNRWERYVRSNPSSVRKRGIWYSRIVFGYITDNSDWGAMLERRLIAAHYGDRRCANILPGGECTDFGMSPFFVYIAFAPTRAVSTLVRDRLRAELGD